MSDKKIVPKPEKKDLAKKTEESLAVAQTIDIDASAVDKNQETQVDPLLPKVEKDEEIEEEAVKDELASVETNDNQADSIREDISTVSANLVSDSASSSGFLAKNKKAIIALLVLLIVAGTSGGGFYFYKTKKDASPSQTETEVGEPVVSPTIEPEAELSPTPIPLARKELKLQVLNGSGTAGKAGKVKELLENLGYEEVDTGNADSYDYKETEIAIKEDKKDYLETLTGDLSEDYVLAQETKTLAEESEFDVVIILGKE